MAEESMYSKFKSGKITRLEYKNWCARYLGYKDEAEYKRRYANNTLIIQEESMWRKWKSGKITSHEYRIWVAEEKGFKSVYEKDKSKRVLTNKEDDRKDYMKSYLNQYYKTPEGKVAMKKGVYKRRKERGYNILNEYFEGSVGHHINKDDVIHIPIDIHKSIPHSFYTKNNMDVINTIAFFFLVMQNINDIIRLFNK